MFEIGKCVMKINQVEELTGITKKNIRFYEEQGLLAPERIPGNGYRDYSMQDVDTLMKIKLLRKLSVPVEEIRRMLEGKLLFSDCMALQETRLGREQRRAELTKEFCSRLASENKGLKELCAEGYLEEISRLEKGSIAFSDVNKCDVSRKKKNGAIISAGVIAGLIALVIGMFIWSVSEGVPIGVVFFIISLFTVLMVGVVIALIKRIKEIDKGEEDEASKY